MKKVLSIPLITIIILIIIILVYWIYVWIQEDRLMKKITSIEEGMDEDEVIQLLGEPKRKVQVKTDEITKGWSIPGQGDFERVKKEYIELVSYVYYIKRYNLMKLRERLPAATHSIYIDPASRKVVYVKSIFIMSYW